MTQLIESLHKMNRNSNEELFPIELDCTILQPDPYALQEAYDAHLQFDEPDAPFILANTVNLFADAI